MLGRERVGVQAGGQDAAKDGVAFRLDPEISGRKATVEAVAMPTPGGGGAVAQSPIGLFASRGFGFLGLQADPQEGRRMQRMGGIRFAFDQSLVESGVVGSQRGEAGA